MVQHLIDRVSESMRKNFDFESMEKDILTESEGVEEGADVLDKSDDLRDANGELDNCVRVLDRVLELGVKRLKPDFDGDNNRKSESPVSSGAVIEEGELVCLSRVISDYAGVFDALSWNIQRQVRGWDGDDSGLALMVRGNENETKEDFSGGEEEEEYLKALVSVQRTVQLTHLNYMKECMKEGNIERAVPWIRFLHTAYGVEEAEYRYFCLLFFFFPRDECLFWSTWEKW